MTEILINKFLDSEITPAEQQMLDAELQENPDSQLLLQQLKQLQQQAQEALAIELLENGDTAEKIFKKALAKTRKNKTKKQQYLWLKTAMHMAAGFILAIGITSAINYSNINRSPAPKMTTGQPARTSNIVTRINQPNIRLRKKQPQRHVDWYNYTSPDGTKWLVENYRENPVIATMYHGDL